MELKNERERQLFDRDWEQLLSSCPPQIRGILEVHRDDVMKAVEKVMEFEIQPTHVCLDCNTRHWLKPDYILEVVIWAGAWKNEVGKLESRGTTFRPGQTLMCIKCCSENLALLLRVD